MSEQKPEQDKDLITRLAIIASVIGGFMISLIYQGATRRETWQWKKIKIWFVYSLFAAIICFGTNRNLPYYIEKMSKLFPRKMGPWIYYHLSPFSQFMFVTIGPFLFWLSLIGVYWIFKVRKFQKAIDHLGMKTSTGLTLKVSSVETISPGLNNIIVQAAGFDLTEIRSKKAILESCLNLFVQDIRLSEKNRGVIEIRVSDKELPTLISFHEASSRLTEPFSFLVGDGMRGFITATLVKVHHLLVAGASGKGKSYFVKQILIGLLRSSKYIQLYLLDLKMGVEVKVFEPLDNVFIAKNTVDAVETLRVVVDEMECRFLYLEKNGFTEIDCKRDKLDRIVVLVDEASELFTVVKGSKAAAALAYNARDLADKISKLGRVAGIHLILATQKVVKETIDTRIQTNINARIIFRVNTTAASMTVLGNKLAADLPEISGRGIWSVGSRDLIVQTPKLDNEEVAAQVAQLVSKFNGEASPLFGKMLINKGHTSVIKNDSNSNDFKKDGFDASEEAF